MSINFSRDRWDNVIDAYDKWWNNKLERPIVSIVASGKEPGRTMPAAPLLSQQTCTDFSSSADDIADRLDYELSKEIYIGDAFPRVNLDFGPGVLSAFCGAKLDNSSGVVWFHPPQNINELTDIHFEYDPNNKWFCRIKDICGACVKRWKGSVLIGMPDLGMGFDILASFRTTEQLLYDLYDYPDEIKRLLGELSELWMKYYDEINSIIRPANQGYTDWSGIYSDKPSYILQSDFSHMIGTPMYKEFVIPDISDMCKKLGRSVYHLDGVGQLPHLDSLLEIDELSGVQWISGAGNPDNKHWPDVYKKIYAAGKKIQLFGMPDALDTVGRQIGDFKSICLMGYTTNCNTDDLERQLKVYGL